jgi:hypothetical protein
MGDGESCMFLILKPKIHYSSLLLRFRNNTIGRGGYPAAQDDMYRRERATSVFYVNRDDFPSVAGKNAQLANDFSDDDEDVIYGDNWSSSSDEEDEADEQTLTLVVESHGDALGLFLYNFHYTFIIYIFVSKLKHLSSMMFREAPFFIFINC